MMIRTPVELLAALARYARTAREGKRDIYRYARTIGRNFTRSADELLAEQNRAAVKMVNYAYQNSPHYYHKYSEAGFSPGDVKDVHDLANLPTISRQELIDHIDDVLCRPKSEMELARTGGTTGVPLRLYRTPETADLRRGIDLAVTRYYGWKDGQWRAWLWAASSDLVAPAGIKSRLVRRLADRQFFMDVSHIDSRSIAEFLKLVRKHRPTFVSAYPSLAFTVADYIDRGLVDEQRVPVISLTAEPLYDFQKEKINRCFADEVFERYGSREIGTAAIECRAHTGLHMLTESVYFETTLSDNVHGRRLLATDLINKGMPLIRYETGDCAEIDTTPCPCGLNTPRLKKVFGREIDAILRPDGSALAGLLVAPRIRQAGIPVPVQVVQNKVNEIVVKVAGDIPTFQSQIKSFKEFLQDDIGTEVTITIEQVTHIERPPSGKYRYVISHVTKHGSALAGNSD